MGSNPTAPAITRTIRTQQPGFLSRAVFLLQQDHYPGNKVMNLIVSGIQSLFQANRQALAADSFHALDQKNSAEPAPADLISDVLLALFDAHGSEFFG